MSYIIYHHLTVNDLAHFLLPLLHIVMNKSSKTCCWTILVRTIGARWNSCAYRHEYICHSLESSPLHNNWSMGSPCGVRYLRISHVRSFDTFTKDQVRPIATVRNNKHVPRIPIITYSGTRPSMTGILSADRPRSTMPYGKPPKNRAAIGFIVLTPTYCRCCDFHDQDHLQREVWKLRLSVD